MEKEIHHVEEFVFREGFCLVSEEVFHKKNDALKEGYHEFFYKNESDEKRIFLELFFAHTKQEERRWNNI